MGGCLQKEGCGRDARAPGWIPFGRSVPLKQFQIAWWPFVDNSYRNAMGRMVKPAVLPLILLVAAM